MPSIAGISIYVIIFTVYLFSSNLFLSSRTTADNATGILLLSEVGLGKMYEINRTQYMDKPPKGKTYIIY